MLFAVRPPSNKKWFPVYRQTRLKRADWNSFFSRFLKKVFSLIFSVHPSQHENENGGGGGGGDPALPTGFFFFGGGGGGGGHTVYRKRFFI